MASLKEKSLRLETILKEMGSTLIAFSGGTDSTLLLKVAYDTLGDKAVAITATSPTLEESELAFARQMAKEIGVAHVVVEVNELECLEFSANPPERCYHCKKIRFFAFSKVQSERALKWVIDGTNADDEGDWRPGIRAAVELGIRSPLKEAGLTKDDVRTLSAELGLATWNKPSMACLASRVPYGDLITREKLSQIAKAEGYLRELGFMQLRVRHHGDMARIEVPVEDMAALLEKSSLVVKKLKETGFFFVALDLAGFKSGSMNATLDK